MGTPLFSRHGFSLVEMLVVLVIVGVVSVAGIVLVAPSTSDRVMGEGQRFAATYDLLFEEAMLQGNSRGVVVWQHGYALYQRLSGGAWELIADSPFAARRLDHGLGLQLSLDGRVLTLARDMPGKPQLWLSPGGATQPFQLLIFDRHESQNEYRLEVDGPGRRSWDRRAG